MIKRKHGISKPAMLYYFHPFSGVLFMKRILIAEDEADLLRALQVIFEHNGYTVDGVGDGKTAVISASKRMYDCIVLDVMMPVMDGIEALKELRKSGNTTPVLMLTAKTELEDRVAGLDGGADDYLTKPFAMQELLARVNSLMRRQSDYMPDVIRLGNVILNIKELELSASNSIRLSSRESKLLALLMNYPERRFSAEELFHMTWEDEPDTEPGVVRIYIAYLQQKISALGIEELQIEGTQEEGYCLKQIHQKA